MDAIPLSHTKMAQKFPPTKTIEIRRVKLECVIDEAVANKLQRAREVLRKQYPKGRFEDILNEALETLLEKRDPERKIARSLSRRSRQAKSEVRRISSTKVRDYSVASLSRNDRRKIPSPDGRDSSPSARNDRKRYIPQHVRREVWKRDEGRCTFKGRSGKKCQERGNLEIDHVRPYSLGGEADLGNIRLLCAEHNRYRALKTFGEPSLQ